MGYASQLKVFKVTVEDKPEFFQSKGLAKIRRDRAHAPKDAGRVVMRGPDHWRGESFNKTKRTRGSRSNW